MVRGKGGAKTDPARPDRLSLNSAPARGAILEREADLSPEEIERARRDYLLTRFWISQRIWVPWWQARMGVFSRPDRLDYYNRRVPAINVWNRARSLTPSRSVTPLRFFI
jgi:hypothetical protein